MVGAVQAPLQLAQVRSGSFVLTSPRTYSPASVVDGTVGDERLTDGEVGGGRVGVQPAVPHVDVLGDHLTALRCRFGLPAGVAGHAVCTCVGNARRPPIGSPL